MTDQIIYRAELMKKLGVTSETIRQWLKKGRLPKPDIALSRRTVGWRLSTLNAHGVGIV